MIKSFKILSLVLLTFTFLSTSYTSQSLKKTQSQISDDKVSMLLKNFFDAVSEQNLKKVSSVLSKSFVNDNHPDKNSYINALRESAKRSEIIKLDHEVIKITNFGLNIKALVKIQEIKIYLKSALVSQKHSKAMISVVKEGSGLKILRIDFEKELPLLKESDNFYRNNWTYYKLGKLKNYETFGMDYRGVMEYLTILPQKEPWEMYLSSVHLDQDIPSAFWMAKKDVDYLKRTDIIKISKINKCSYHKYDCGLLEFKKLIDGTAKLEKRVYFYRKPLMYVMGITATETEEFVKGEKDFNRLINLFSYLPTEKHLKRMLVPSNLKAGSLFKSNFYGFSLDSPVNWQVYAYRPGTVQFKPLKRSSDDLAFVNVTAADNLKEFVEDQNKLLKSFYKYYESNQIKDTSIKNKKGIDYTYKFKKSFFSRYRYKDSLFMQKGPYIYELAFVSDEADSKKRALDFSKFIKAFKFE